MRSTLLFIVSLILLASCSAKEPPPVSGFVQQWASGCMRAPESCQDDIAFTWKGDIFKVEEIDGQIVPHGTWPDLSRYTGDSRKLSVFLLGLENAGRLGAIEHVVRADLVRTNPRMYTQALNSWKVAMDLVENEGGEE